MPAQIPGLTKEQLQQMSTHQLGSMTNAQINKFTAYQLNECMSPAQLEAIGINPFYG